MKGFSLVTSDSIRNNQLNSSTAKNSFLFSKEERFRVPASKYNCSYCSCPVAFYEYPHYLSKRKTSLGYGEKSDFTHSSVVSPAANSYQIESDFKKDGKRGQTFGVAREVLLRWTQKSPENGIIVKDVLKFPGPGQYECKKDTLSTIAYTCRPRTIDFVGSWRLTADKKITYRQNPGPGAYEYVNAFPEDGRTFVSKFTSSKFAKINNSPRFITGKDSPGPHTYDVRNNMSQEGKYLLSKNRGDGTRAFSQTARHGFTDIISKNSIST